MSSLTVYSRTGRRTRLGVWLSGLLISASCFSETPAQAQQGTSPSLPQANPAAEASPTPPQAEAKPIEGEAKPAGEQPQAAQPQAAQAEEHGFQAQPDRSMKSEAVPVRTIDALIVDARGTPLPNEEVRLGIVHQTITSGEQREQRSLKSGVDGRVRFDNLPGNSLAYSYRVSVKKGEALFAVPPFQLDERLGQQVLLHVYDVTTDIASAQVGMFSFLYVETRDDVFAFEVLFRLYNIGQTAWVPKNIGIELPKDWKAFRVQDTMSDVRFEADGDRLTLRGTVPPGQHEAIFSFHVPNKQRTEQSFEMKLPPRVGQMQVVAAAPKGMQLQVDSFEPAQVIPSRNGQRSIGSLKRLQPGDPALDLLRITLTGIPTRGSGPWVALGLALVCVFGGLWLGLKGNKVSSTRRETSELREAQDLILAELVSLEQAHQAGEIGPKTYQEARKALLDAVARLEVQQKEA